LPQLLALEVALACHAGGIALRSRHIQRMAANVEFGLKWVRQRQRVLTRGVLALFCLAWLQVAAIPCVMASADAAGPAHPGHECPYCPPADAAPAGCDGHGSCAYPHGPQVDARAAAPLFLALPATLVLPSFDAVNSGVVMAVAALPEPVPRVPIPISFCRFIE
jgi:hypothetical protein